MGSILANASDARRVRIKWSGAARDTVAEPRAATKRRAALTPKEDFILSQLADDWGSAMWTAGGVELLRWTERQLIDWAIE